MFQSTPVISDGRASLSRLQRCAQHRFNPRPSFLTGVPPTCSASPRAFTVFQSTPVISDGRATFTFTCQVEGQVFQSTPVISDGRATVRIDALGWMTSFQSTPVISDGRASATTRRWGA